MAKARLVIKLLDGGHHPIQNHKINFKKDHDFPGQDLVTGADGTAVAEVPADVVQVTFAPASLPGGFSTILGGSFDFDVASDGTVTESGTHSNEVLVGKKQIVGTEKVTEIAIVIPRIGLVDRADSRLPGFWQFPTRDLSLPNSPAGVEDSFSLGFGHVTNVTPLIFLFEMRHIRRPALVAVAVRNGVTTLDRFLLFYHHTISLQNKAVYDGVEYPFGEAYMKYGFHAYLDGRLKLAYQLAASGSEQTLVLPLPQSGVPEVNELGEFNSNPTVVQGVLEEIGGFFQRFFNRGLSIPSIASFTIGHFSSGILHTGTFLKAKGGLAARVEEVYDLDGSHSDHSRIFPPTSFRKTGRVVWIFDQDGTVKDAAAVKARAERKQYSLPWDRWDRCIEPIRPPSTLPKFRPTWLHNNAIPRHMLFHALKRKIPTP
jgi:hypothetical protein